MTKRPVEKQEAISAFYAERAVDVSYYSALWHTFNVGHLMVTFARGLVVLGSKYWRVSWGKTHWIVGFLPTAR